MTCSCLEGLWTAPQGLHCLQLSILGVCCGPGSGGDPLAELSIVQLSGYSISADGVTMCTVASTPAGRIFLGGADGHLYEIVYSSSDGWVTKRMSKAWPALSLLNI